MLLQVMVEEVATTMNKLKAEGQVRYVGLSRLFLSSSHILHLNLRLYGSS